MDNFVKYVSENPMAAMMVMFIVLLVIYFIFKQLLKMALFFVIILILVTGYYYFKDPHKSPENIQQYLSNVKNKTVRLVDAGKNAYNKGKDMYGKVKKLNEDFDKLTGREKAPDKEKSRTKDTRNLDEK